MFANLKLISFLSNSYVSVLQTLQLSKNKNIRSESKEKNRKSKSPSLAKFNISFNDQFSPQDSKRNSRLSDYRRSPSKPHYFDSQNEEKYASSEIENLKIEQIKGSLKDVRSELEALKGYYNRQENQQGVSREPVIKKVISEKKLSSLYENVAFNNNNNNTYEYFKPLSTYLKQPKSRPPIKHSYNSPVQLPRNQLQIYQEPERINNLFSLLSNKNYNYQNDQDNRKYTNDYLNLYQGFYPHQNYGTIKQYTHEKNDLKQALRKKSVLPDFVSKSHNLASSYYDKPAASVSYDLDQTLNNYAMAPPLRSQSYPLHRKYSVNHTDYSMTSKNVQPSYFFHRPQSFSRQQSYSSYPRKYSVVNEISSTLPYQNDSALKFYNTSIPPSPVREKRSVSYHSTYSPSNYTSYSYKPISSYEPSYSHNRAASVNMNTNPYRYSKVYYTTPPQNQTYQDNYVSTKNIILNSQSTLNNLDKRQIHTVENLNSSKETYSEYFPKSNYNYTLSNPLNAYNKYPSNQMGLSHREKDLLFKQYSVDTNHTHPVSFKSTNETVGTKLVHIKPRRFSEACTNKNADSFCDRRHRIMSFSAANKNSSWVGSSKQNPDYHDGHFFDDKQQVISPPTRVTAPQVCIGV